MIDERLNPDDRGQAWTVFFGLAAILVGVLVLVTRIVALVDGGAQPLTAAALQPAQAPFAVDVGAAIPTQPALASDLPVASLPLVTESPETSISAFMAPPSAPIESAPAQEAPTATPQPPPAPAVAAAALPPARRTVAAPVLSAGSAAIIERSCGALVYGKAETMRVAPASLTKMVTAMVVAERADLNSMVEIRDVSAKGLIKSSDSSVMGVEPGMRFSVRDLLYGLMLPSGNDAALVLAQKVSGGVPGFVALMNNKAAGIGLNDTHFTNPHGLDEPGLYSTALDMAKAGRAYLASSMLSGIATTAQYETPGDVRILMKNGNRLLQTYPGSFGVKIGYTTNAKQTIVAAANRDGRELVLSVMGSENRYEDSAALFDWAFANTAPACR